MQFSAIRAFAIACAMSLGLVTAVHADVIADISELKLKSSAVLVLDDQTGEVLFSRNTDAILPIASITKLMTAMVTLDAGLPLDETISVTHEDVDTLKGTGSRLRVGTELSRDDLLKLALMASENRAASALAGAYPGGRNAFVQAMNAKARQLGMKGTYYVEPTGLSSSNVSTAEDLAKLVRAAQTYQLISDYSTLANHRVRIGTRSATFNNTNGLVRSGNWEIGLQKTGYISEAGRCLVMQAKLAARSVIIVLLDSWGKYTRIADANRIRQWLEPEFIIPQPVKKITRASSRSKVKAATRKPVKVVRTSSGRVKTQVKAKTQVQ
ncbi:MAG TPA: D-alanyl-D-alanine endopeptidase [Burkholderiales bacterium]|jgi:serine-type D-Ala-D-Ala endopeptidase (penicillin-binding protein 7)|nr:D-alanyl-D-alanine endopeptidase [Burkholderiales bacterium]